MGWGPNESFYRHYLDKYLASRSDKPFLEPVSYESEVEAICERWEDDVDKVFIFQHAGQLPYFEYFASCSKFVESERLDFNGVTVVSFSKVMEQVP
jgi:hypothetical protein